MLFTSAQKNPAIGFFKGPYNLANSLSGGTVSLTGGTLGLPANAGSLTPGNQIFYRLAATAPDGRPSADLFGVMVIP